MSKSQIDLDTTELQAKIRECDAVLESYRQKLQDCDDHREMLMGVISQQKCMRTELTEQLILKLQKRVK